MMMLPLHGTIWFGDSGGAVYGLVHGEMVLVGVMSNFSVSDGLIFENSATKVRFYHDWIMEVLNGREIDKGVGVVE